MAKLALARSASRRSLATDLWPDRDFTSASNNLRVTLSYLRCAFQEAGVDPMPVESDRHRVWLTPMVRWSIDTEEFERCVADLPAEGVRLDHPSMGYAAREAQVASDRSTVSSDSTHLPSSDPLWTQAVSWYRGDFLSGLDVPAELEIERERLRSLFVTAAVRLGAYLLERGRMQAALKVASRAVVADPWSESAGVLIVKCQVGLGDRAGAARSLERCLCCDAELGIAPSDELRMLIEALQT